MIAAATMALMGTHAEAGAAYFWSLSNQAPSPRDTFELRVSRTIEPDAAPMVARIYIESPDAGAGRTEAINGDLWLPDGRVATFQLKLPAGTHTVRYYETEAPDFSLAADAVAEIVVTATGPVSVIEYRHPQTGHFFITADADEIALLDQGVIAGWLRTGESFHAITPRATIGVLPVCRLYGVLGGGYDTHFFSDRPDECAGAVTRWPAIWHLESSTAFALPVDYARGCDTIEYKPLYRLYNNRPDANHRYTVSPAIRNDMIAAGWVLEGDPYDGRWSCALR